MTKLKTFLATQLLGTRAYLPFRTAYRALFNRGYLQRQRAMSSFYQQFVRPGCLVFDVGANIGNYTDVFLSLGAQVVAIEPNASLCTSISGLSSKGKLSVHCEALGDQETQMTLHIAAQSGCSTLSEEWIRVASRSPGSYSWKGESEVHMTTLDRIRDAHGTPDFIKIDVECYEDKVLRGMSFRPLALSFEFPSLNLVVARNCLALPAFESNCQFNVVLCDEWTFAWPEWRGKHAVLEWLAAQVPPTYGDIYVRFDHPNASFVGRQSDNLTNPNG